MHISFILPIRLALAFTFLGHIDKSCYCSETTPLSIVQLISTILKVDLKILDVTTP